MEFGTLLSSHATIAFSLTAVVPTPCLPHLGGTGERPTVHTIAHLLLVLVQNGSAHDEGGEGRGGSGAVLH
jgi:hypothetical protein